jgi:hypothetical protein
LIKGDSICYQPEHGKGGDFRVMEDGFERDARQPLADHFGAVMVVAAEIDAGAGMAFDHREDFAAVPRLVSLLGQQRMVAADDHRPFCRIGSR